MNALLVFGFIAVYCSLLFPRPRTCAVIAFAAIGWCAVEEALAGQVANTISALITAAVYGGTPLVIAGTAPRGKQA